LFRDDTSLLELELDLMIYILFGLSAEEIGVVEGAENRQVIKGCLLN
jgi:hypothetical protein